MAKLVAYAPAAIDRAAAPSQGEAGQTYELSAALRTPLASISGYVELLLEGELGPLSDEQRRALLVVQQNAQRLETLVTALVECRRSQRA